jgi:F-type H+-transporting ATPase subunit b
MVAGLLLAASPGGGPLANIFNLGLTVWTVVLFGLFALVLTRFGWKPLLKVIEERERSVQEAVDGAHKASAEAQALLEQHKQLLRDSTRERDEIMKRTLKEAEQLRSDVQARARSEAEALLARAKEQIARETGQAILEIRGQVADLAVEAAAKIVRSSLTPEAQRKLVTDFIDGLPKAGR